MLQHVFWAQVSQLAIFILIPIFHPSICSGYLCHLDNKERGAVGDHITCHRTEITSFCSRITLHYISHVILHYIALHVTCHITLHYITAHYMSSHRDFAAGPGRHFLCTANRRTWTYWVTNWNVFTDAAHEIMFSLTFYSQTKFQTQSCVWTKIMHKLCGF